MDRLLFRPPLPVGFEGGHRLRKQVVGWKVELQAINIVSLFDPSEEECLFDVENRDFDERGQVRATTLAYAISGEIVTKSRIECTFDR